MTTFLRVLRYICDTHDMELLSLLALLNKECRKIVQTYMPRNGYEIRWDVEEDFEKCVPPFIFKNLPNKSENYFILSGPLKLMNGLEQILGMSFIFFMAYDKENEETFMFFRSRYDKKQTYSFQVYKCNHQPIKHELEAVDIWAFTKGMDFTFIVGGSELFDALDGKLVENKILYNYVHGTTTLLNYNGETTLKIEL